ncbi:MAG: lysylphosphatidylglycerol synthase transmembrane domain-containing protein [Bacteroidota bacterium]
MSQQVPDLFKNFSFRKVMWPVIIGLVATIAIMFYNDFTGEGELRKGLSQIDWTKFSIGWMIMGFLMMVLRDFAYIWRMRILTNGDLSWRRSFDLIMLWEFSSALSPSIVGGSAVAIFLMNKENISIGRGTAIIFLTILLDEIFYLLILPTVLLFFGYDIIFAPVPRAITIPFWTAYVGIFIYTIFLIMALIVYPQGIHRGLKKLFHTRFFKRWQKGGYKMADDLLEASYEIRANNFWFWLKATASTLLAWAPRYLVLNCVIAAFAVTSLGLGEHIIAFARQAIMFIMMLVSPTPGSSGVAEYMFTLLLSDFTPKGISIALAAVWRLISYYPYLLIGAIMVPRWINRVYGGKKQLENEGVDPSANEGASDEEEVLSTSNQEA